MPLHFDFCRTAVLAEEMTANFLNLENGRRRWRVLETSVTDILIAVFATSTQNVVVDAANESLTGGDIEIHLVKGNRQYSLYLQAKRADRSDTRTPYWYYKHLFHPGNTGAQKTDLLNYCANNAAFPVYAFYHPKDAVTANSNEFPDACGLNLCSAVHLANEAYQARNMANRKVDYYLPNSCKFSDLFCSFHRTGDEFDEWMRTRFLELPADAVTLPAATEVETAADEALSQSDRAAFDPSLFSDLVEKSFTQYNKESLLSRVSAKRPGLRAKLFIGSPDADLIRSEIGEQLRRTRSDG